MGKVTMKPGIYPGISREAYEAIDAINWSILKVYDRSPLHAKWAMDHPKAPTPAMERGTAVHMAVLEPDRFDLEYVVAPKVDRRTKKGKLEWSNFEEANEGKSYVSQKDMDYICAVRSKIRKHPTILPLLTGPGLNECAVVAERKLGDSSRKSVLCKSLIDRIKDHDGYTWVLDFKSTIDAEPERFGKQAANLDYPPQGGFYLDNLEAAVPAGKKERRFLFIAWESDPPHEPKVYELDEEDLRVASERARRLLRVHARCVDKQYWPGYHQDIEIMRLPEWYRKKS